MVYIVTAPRCTKGHLMHYMPDDLTDPDYICELCGWEKHPENGEYWKCDECDKNICSECHPINPGKSTF